VLLDLDDLSPDGVAGRCCSALGGGGGGGGVGGRGKFLVDNAGCAGDPSPFFGPVTCCFGVWTVFPVSAIAEWRISRCGGAGICFCGIGEYFDFRAVSGGGGGGGGGGRRGEAGGGSVLSSYEAPVLSDAFVVTFRLS